MHYKNLTSESQNPPVSLWIQAETRGQVIQGCLNRGDGTEVIVKLCPAINVITGKIRN